jgi:hypothetical protein
MWPLAVGPKEQVGIARAQDAMLETMSLDSRRLNDRLVGPPSRLVHDKARHAVPNFRSPGMPRDPSPMTEQDTNTAGFRHAALPRWLLQTQLNEVKNSSTVPE